MPPPDQPRGPGLTFTKRDRLLRRSEFLAVQAKGRKLHAAHFIVSVLDRGDTDPPRIGITTSRKSAKAVGRNRFRRLVREVFRLNRGAFPVGCDCVVIAREDLPDLTLAQVRDALLGALQGRRSPANRREKPRDDTQARERPKAPPPGAKPAHDPKRGSAGEPRAEGPGVPGAGGRRRR